MNDFEFESIYEAATKYAKKRENMLETHQEPEDFASYCVEKKLTNSYRRLSWMFVDYLREGSGRKGSNSYSERQELKRATSLNAVIGDSKTERIELLYVGGGGNDFEIREKLKRLTAFIPNKNKRLKKIIGMKLEGFTDKEIGEKLSVTESRISQILYSFLNPMKNKADILELDSLNKGVKEWIKKQLP